MTANTGERSALSGTWPEERKLVSILFADLTGYTALAASLDPEEVYRFLRPTVRHLQGIVEDHGGTVPQILGDGFMAVFGVPVAHEDDAERAVRAALAVRDHVTELNEGREGLPFPAVHAGVNSGEVMVAPADEHAGFAVVGDTVNVASRLADLAPGGHVLVDAWTRDRTAHAIAYGPLRRRRAKGKAEPLAVYEAIEAKGSRPAPRAPRAASSAFLDREEVLERLADEVAAVDRERRSRVLVVTGDAGVGKSRLAGELHHRLRGTSILSGRCAAFGDRLPLAALAEALGGAAGVGPGSPPPVVREAVTELAGRIAPASESPALAIDLQRLLGAERPGAEQQSSISSMSRAARTVLEGLAGSEPVTVILDDLHWGDPDLIELLRLVAASPWDAPILFLGLARPEHGISGVATLELDALPEDVMEALAEHILGGAVPRSVLDIWLARAAGNPLFLGEVIGMLIESGALVSEDGAWRVTDPQRVEQVPATIRLLIAARLDGLPPDEKRLLQDAAVCGESTWDHLLERLTEIPLWRPALRSLEARGLLVRSPQSRIPSAVEYAFKHVLIREVAYESISKAERVERHLAVAGWLREIAPILDQEPVSALAYHYERAWRLGRTKTGELAPEAASHAARYLTLWAESTFASEARSAEAIFQRALAASREAGRGLEPEVVGKLLIGMAETLIELGRHDEGREAALEARRIATRIEDDRLLGRTSVALGRVQNDRGQPVRARAHLRHALALFEGTGDLVGQGWAMHRMSETYSFTDYRRELDHLRSAHRLMVRGRDAYGRSVVAQDLAYLLTVYGGREFHRWYEEARRRIVGEEDTRSRASLLRTLGYFVYYQGRFAEAVRVMREARPIAIESGDRYTEADTLLIDAMGTGAISSPEEAVPIADEAIALGREVGSKRIRALGGLVRARASLRSGDPLKASRQLGAVRKLLEGAPTRPDLIEVTLMEASLRLDRGDWPGAIAAGEELGEAAVRIGWRMWEPQGALIVGRAHLGAGRAGAASQALATAATLARRCDAVGPLALARALRTEARLLDGHGEAGIAVDEDDPVTGAVVSESDGLRWARMERWDSAAAAFADAVERWGRIGLTVWLARALAFRAEALRRAGQGRAATASQERAEEILAALRTPARERARLLKHSALGE